jgi:hypothetical protein
MENDLLVIFCKQLFGEIPAGFGGLVGFDAQTSLLPSTGIIACFFIIVNNNHKNQKY